MVYLVPFFIRMKSYGKIEEITRPLMYINNEMLDSENENENKQYLL